MSLKKYIRKGKSGSGNTKKQRYINVFVLAGFVMLFVWQSILFKNIFMPVYVVWLLILISSTIVTFFAYRKILAVCGYVEKHGIRYKILMRLLVLVLVAIPVGNASALAFMTVNNVFADPELTSMSIHPANVEEIKGKRGKAYTAFVIRVDGVTKTQRLMGSHAQILEGRTVEINLRKGFFGYRVMVGGYRIK